MGRIWRALKLGMKSLLLHKLRSGLTVLGIVFGVAAVIAMLAIAEGSSREALERIRALGATNIIVKSAKPSDEAQATGNLDTATSHEIMAMLGKLNDAGKTIIMVTHEQDIADHAKRVIKMQDGKIIYDGPSPRMQQEQDALEGTPTHSA